jgi:hypothetical protein
MQNIIWFTRLHALLQTVISLNASSYLRRFEACRGSSEGISTLPVHACVRHSLLEKMGFRVGKFYDNMNYECTLAINTVTDLLETLS